MPLKTEEIEEPILNLTPMIDIVLLLIIFFMVGTKFSDAERQFEIKLPTVSDAIPLSSLPDQLIVSVTEAGDIFLGKNELSLEELGQELKIAKEQYDDQSVVVRGDLKVTYQKVMNVLSICHRMGIKNLSLANRLASEGE